MTNGARIVGNYTLGALLGRGGTSEVYAATHRFLGDEVAVKVLRPELATDDAVTAAFVAEAARTREIAHPNVVRVVDFGRDDTTCYLVMERLGGGSLAARLKAGTLPEAELRPLAAAIADGMDAAHARGIVHRDLKPGNIMLRGGQPTIVDFGIAKSLDASSSIVTNRRIGTLAYMAPEQLTEGLITPAADVWALGVVMYEAVTGRLPYDNFNDGRLPQLFDTPPRAGTLAAISPALDALIARCIDRSPGARPTMREVAAALRAPEDERFTEDAGPVVAPIGPRAAPLDHAGPRVPSLMVAHAGLRAPGAASNTLARRRKLWPAAAVGGVAIAGALAYVAWPRGSQPASSPVPAAQAPPTASSVPSPTTSSEPPSTAGTEPAATARTEPSPTTSSEPPPTAGTEPPARVEPSPSIEPTASSEPPPRAAPARTHHHAPSRTHHSGKRPTHTTQGETLD
jgi:serine/threonine-protein kinase